MTGKTVKRSITMNSEMHDLLMQVAASRGRGVTEVDLIREAISEYLEAQADLIGSRRHFHQSLQTLFEHFEAKFAFHMNVLLCLEASAISSDSIGAIEEAIIAAKRDGEILSLQIATVRDLKDEP